MESETEPQLLALSFWLLAKRKPRSGERGFFFSRIRQHLDPTQIAQNTIEWGTLDPYGPPVLIVRHTSKTALRKVVPRSYGVVRDW